MAKPKPISADVTISPPPERYTLDGDERVEARIAQDQRMIAAAVAKVVPAEHFAAVVMMGGYGRGEGGYVERETAQGLEPAPYNDYDYFVIVRKTGRAERERLNRQLAGVAKQLESQVGVEVDFALLRSERLRRAEPSLMNAEMLWGHRVIAGDREVLSRMQPMPFPALAPGELTRLMLNRGALLLMNQQQLTGAKPAWESVPGSVAGGEELDAERREVFFKYLSKAILACGDVRLALSGCYHPSFPVKLERLEGLKPLAPWGELLERDADAFLRLYRFAYRNKFHPDYRALTDESLVDWQMQVRRIWLSSLRAFESYRLGKPVQSWAEYCRPEVGKGQRGGAGGWLRNLAITIRDFGVREVLSRPAPALRYPRERLIASLPMLLSEAGQRPDPCVCAALGLPSDTDWQQAAATFLRYWRRYA